MIYQRSTGYTGGIALSALTPVLLWAAPVQAQPAIVLPFAPPNTPLLFETVTERSIRGQLIRHRVQRQVQFTRVNDGYAIECHIVTQTIDGPEPVVKLMEISTKALENQTFRFHIGRDGSALRATDFPGSWQLISDGIDRLLADDGPALSPMARAARAMMARQLKGMAEVDRQAIVLNEVVPILAWAGRPVAAGVSDGVAGSTRIDQVRQEQGQLLITQSARSGEVSGTTSILSEIRVSMGTGLVESLQSQTVTDDGHSQRAVHTSLRLIKWPD